MQRKISLVNKKMLTPPRVLFIRTGAMGDALLLTPIIHRFYDIRKGDCIIDIKTGHPSLFLSNPFINKVIYATDEFNYLDYNIIYNLDYSYENNNNDHVLSIYEKYVFGSISEYRQCEIYSTFEDEVYVDELINNISTKKILIHMRNVMNDNINHSAKNISPKIWESIISQLLTNTSATIIQIGAQTDLGFSGNDRLLDYRMKLTPQQIKVLATKSDCFLSSDSGPAHIAATTDINMIVLYTIANIDYFKPYRFKGNLIAIEADIECKGCLSTMPKGATLINCHRGDAECRNRFDPFSISQKAIELIDI